ncbi:MAG: MBL fold metallo-hydrolase, partial [Erysipelotrichaceae bacterium]|nr:MBL fold metallo-hydrolase [Erysipelotrichaceae bacterium]
MSKKASNFQKVVMSWGYRGKEIFKPLNTGWIDERTACVREWIANIFFYRKNGTTIMIDAGYNYERLAEKMKWLDIDPSSIKDILITHQDTDHVGAVEKDSDGLFRHARLYLSEIENQYMSGEKRRKVIFGLYKLPMVKSDNEKRLLKDGEVFFINDIKVEAILVPGHTWGHMVYLIDDAYLFTGDTIWFGADGGYSFINSLAEDNELAKRSLVKLENLLRERGISPKVITGHTGWSDDLDFVFAHKDRVCNSLKKQKPHDPKAPYDGYDEKDDTEYNARHVKLEKATYVSDKIQEAYRSSKNIYDTVLTQG